jgi:hypothetical protein
LPRRDIEKELQALKSLQTSGESDEAERVLRKALRDRVNLIVARAAQVAAARQFHTLIPDLCSAFDRMFEKPIENDPQCWAKTALAKALTDLGYDESSRFLRGLRHVQREPVWGRLKDTAFTLRGTCALALPSARDIPRREILQQLTGALTDSQDAAEEDERAEAAPVRRDAIRAVEQMEGEEARLLLRLKARCGDHDAGVTGQALDSLLRLEGEAAVPFVAAFFTWPDAPVREEAALALGASRLPEGAAVLETAWSATSSPDLRDAILRALSASGQDRAIRFLVNIVRTAAEREAVVAISALGLHPLTGALRQQIALAVAERTEERVRAAWAALQ